MLQQKEQAPVERTDPGWGSYETLFSLGKGGMGTAYLARVAGAAGFSRLVVIKRPHPGVVDDPSGIRRFISEARVTASIHHANVVGTHHVGSDAEGYFLVLDYIEGASLSELVEGCARREKPLPTPIVLRIALDALSGLDAVHRAHDELGRPLQILHRDVSMQNVLIGCDGLARISDFGVAKSNLPSVSTEKGYFVGKLLYLPPEYLRRDAVGPTYDIYSLGITLWLAVSGRELWPGASEAQVVTHILGGEIPPLGPSVVAPRIEQIITRACAADPNERFQSAREMADAIEALGRETGCVASHSEVASWIHDLIGPELQRRRQQIAGLIGREPDSLTGQRASQVETIQIKFSWDGAKPADAPRHTPRRRLGWWAAGAGLLASAAAIALLVHFDDQARPGAVSDETVSPAPALQAEVPQEFSDEDRAAPSPAPTPAPEPVPEPALKVSEESAETSTTPSVSHAPTGVTPKKRFKRRPPAKETKRRAAPVRAPDDVTTTNPYR